MTRALLMVMLLLLPATALAQEAIPSSSPSPEASPQGLRITLPPLADWNPALLPQPRAAAMAPAQAPPERRRRRPSMVGYIEDASIQSQFRFRFDAGFGNSVPDRAEFFYAKCGCYQLDPPPYFDPDAPGPGPGVPVELDFQQFYVFGELAATDRFSVFAELPFRAIQPQGFIDFGPGYDPWPDQSGFADIRFGAKAGLFAGDNGGVTLQLRASAPSGDPSKGASTDNWSVEPALLFHGNVTDRVGLEGQFGFWHPFGGSTAIPDINDAENFSGDVIFYGIGPSVDLFSSGSSRLSGVVELVGWRVLKGQQTQCFLDATCNYDAEGVNIANLKIGGRATFAERNSLYVGYGWALTDEDWYDKIFRVEYRLAFR